MDLIPLEDITEGVPSTVLEVNAALSLNIEERPSSVIGFWRMLTGENRSTQQVIHETKSQKTEEESKQGVYQKQKTTNDSQHRRTTDFFRMRKRRKTVRCFKHSNDGTDQ